LLKGHDVAILKRSTSDWRRIADLLPRLAAYDVDRCDLRVPFQEGGHIDAVVHAATCYGRQGESCKQILDANVAFPLELLEAAAAARTRVFVNTSSFFTKQSVPYRPMRAYVLSKRHFSEWGKHVAEDFEMRFVDLVLHHVYGPGDSEEKFVTRLIRDCLRGVPEIYLTEGRQRRDFVYVEDVAAAYAAVLSESLSEKGAYEEFEVGSGASVEVREFVGMAHSMADSRALLRFGAVETPAGEPTGGPARTESLKRLGWCPETCLEEGVRRTVLFEKERFCGSS
jgi:nucleoside-diphosphate-sugar epimerase